MDKLFYPRLFFTKLICYALAALRLIAPQEIKPEIEKALRELRIFVKHCNGTTRLKKILAVQAPLRLELGAGERKMPGWFGVDLSETSEIQLDLRRPLPIPENRVDAIYSSHFLEHFSYPDPLLSLIGECYRILSPGGYFSAAVPDGGRYISAYHNGSEIIEPQIREKISPIYLTTKMDQVSWFVYMYGQHHYLFDDENLVQLLKNAGFIDVALREFNPGLDLEIRRNESLYVMAYKPHHGR
jgi:predicted SAM-dependent methyltransferase